LRARIPRLQVVDIETCSAHTSALQRYDAKPGTVYLLRPDQHVCARWRQPDPGAVRAAIDHALAKA
jgi:3-(3-hydroxy-phenyl)propionate hydroxylase